MDSAQRRLRSISRHLLQRENISSHGIKSNLLRGLEQPREFSPSPVIVGGMVLDILAKPDTSPNFSGTTTPGRVQYVSGGVARNVAECMTKLGIKPFMISVVGFDLAGDLLLKFWESSGLPTNGVLKLKDVSTPVVSSIFDCKGELAAGVANIQAVERFLCPDWIWKFRHDIYSAPILMVDANLHPQSLEAACRIAAEFGTPVWFEPVSVTKSARVASIIDYITCASPSENELIAMANALSPKGKFISAKQVVTAGQQPLTVQSLFENLKPAIQLLLSKGTKLLVVTLGPDGVLLCFREAAGFMRNTMKNKESIIYNKRFYELISKYCRHQYASFLRSELDGTHSHIFHLPAPAASVVSVTGAGDCLVGGILASLCSGLDIMQSTAVGIALAKATVEAYSNVPTEISLNRIASEAQQILSTTKKLVFD